MTFCRWFLLLYLMVTPAFAANEPKVAPAEGPIEVTSLRMEADQQAGRVLFIGDVVGKRGGMTIYADQMTIFFTENAAGRQIERIEATGKVRVVESERVATADHLDFQQATEKMTLRGNAEVHQAGNSVAGDEIEIFLRENRSLVKSGKEGRIRAIFTPGQEKQ